VQNQSIGLDGGGGAKEREVKHTQVLFFPGAKQSEVPMKVARLPKSDFHLIFTVPNAS
jgi:hypothetical protein